MMLETLVSIAAIGLTAVIGLGAAYVVGLRTKSPVVIRPLVWFSRRFINPRQMRTAGRPGAYASIIRHRGRRSGRTYETPVGAVPTDDGFVIALPYGTRAQWLRNVLAAGSATLVSEGAVHEVDRPELVRLEAANAWFPAGDQRSHRWFGVEHCLRLRAVPEAGLLAP